MSSTTAVTRRRFLKTGSVAGSRRGSRNVLAATRHGGCLVLAFGSKLGGQANALGPADACRRRPGQVRSAVLAGLFPAHTLGRRLSQCGRLRRILPDKRPLSSPQRMVNLSNPMLMKGPVRELIPIGEQQVRMRLPRELGRKRCGSLRVARFCPWSKRARFWM